VGDDDARDGSAGGGYPAGLEGAVTHRWFLPRESDVIGVLQAQAAVTVEGVVALVAWSNDEPGAADVVRDCEHRADERKRELRRAITAAFMTPLEPEDLYILSFLTDEILNRAKNLVREAEVLGLTPDAATGGMVALVSEGVGLLAGAFAQLSGGSAEQRAQAAETADAAIKTQRRLERVYRQAMADLLQLEDVREMIARHELYRRLEHISDAVVEAAERVWYVLMKEE
jgi:uncharacterized protein Yka (UPF0111/DUF47 family)